MAKVPCPKCKKSIDHQASVCPYCNSAFTEAEIVELKSVNKSLNKSAGYGCLVLIGLSVAIAWCTSQPKSPTEERALFVKYYKGVMPSLNLCETATKVAFRNFSDALSGKVTSITAYEAVARSKATCDEAESKIVTQDKPTGLPEEAQTNFNKYSSSCFAATSARVEALGLVLKALDGELKPSLMNDLTNKGEAVQGDTLRCAAALGGTAAALGIKPEELK